MGYVGIWGRGGVYGGFLGSWGGHGGGYGVMVGKWGDVGSYMGSYGGILGGGSALLCGTPWGGLAA